MLCVLFIGVAVYLVWKLSTEHHSQCECPDCDNCPYPKCKGCEK